MEENTLSVLKIAPGQYPQQVEIDNVRGGGGTDFRPAFEYVSQLCAEKKFSNLRGLLYFTDGMGTYPARRPAYDTAFLFLGDRFDDANVPPWAMKVVLDEVSVRFSLRRTINKRKRVSRILYSVLIKWT